MYLFEGNQYIVVTCSISYLLYFCVNKYLKHFNNKQYISGRKYYRFCCWNPGLFAGARHINIDMDITKWAIRNLTPVSGCPKTLQCVCVLLCQIPGFLLSVSEGYISVMNHYGISLHSGEPVHYVQGNKCIHYHSLTHPPILFSFVSGAMSAYTIRAE